jgi:hypothetical protein
MKKRKHLTAMIALLALTLPTAAQALGPLDAEAGLIWWAHDVDTDDIGNTSADGKGAYGEIWWANNWGVTGDYFESDPDRRGVGSTTDLSIDVKRRLFSPTDNNFIAVGAGWQDTELLGAGGAQGLRLTFDARVGLGLLYVYGKAAWMPDLGNAGIRRDIEGTEYQVGVSLTPFPFLNVRLGYRMLDLDFRGGSQQSDGYLLGAAIHF